jgi:hypothetical protein
MVIGAGTGSRGKWWDTAGETCLSKKEKKKKKKERGHNASVFQCYFGINSSTFLLDDFLFFL